MISEVADELHLHCSKLPAPVWAAVYTKPPRALANENGVKVKDPLKTSKIPVPNGIFGKKEDNVVRSRVK